MKIVKAKISDLKQLKALCKEQDFELDRDWKQLINSKKSEVFFLIDEKNKIIGFTGLLYYDWNNTIQIIDVFVRPEFRGQGLGLKLINFLIERVKKTSYRCLIAEAPSLNPVLTLYKKAGFRKCGYNDKYYYNECGKEICIWMSLDLK